jgi:hypothetical protein
MAIEIRQVGDDFMVEVTPPHGEWRSPVPMSPTDVLAKLSALGCHSTDVSDALDASGADWRATHDTEVRRSRD